MVSCAPVGNRRLVADVPRSAGGVPNRRRLATCPTNPQAPLPPLTVAPLRARKLGSAVSVRSSTPDPPYARGDARDPTSSRRSPPDRCRHPAEVRQACRCRYRAASLRGRRTRKAKAPGRGTARRDPPACSHRPVYRRVLAYGPTCCLYYARPLLHPVVRRFLGDDYVVYVALAQAGGRDAQETRLGLQFGDAAGAAVSHAGSQAAHQLIDQLGERPFGGHAAFDAFGNHLGVGILGIAVEAGFAGRAERAHAAISLERAALIENGLARALVGTGEQTADHDAN